MVNLNLNINKKNFYMECLLWHSFWLSNKHCDLEFVLNIIKSKRKLQLYQSLLLNKIKPEKCDLEMILTYNLRLRKSLRLKFVSKNRLRHVCDFFLSLRMCFCKTRLWYRFSNRNSIARNDAQRCVMVASFCASGMQQYWHFL